MRLVLKSIFLLLLSLYSTHIFAQNKISIESADSLLGGRNTKGEAVRKLIGNVKLTQGSTSIYGDSVILYPQRNMTEVFGKRVRVEEGDSIVVTGKKLVYNGNTRTAEMRNDVIYKDPSMTLYTDYLNFDIPNNFAYYYEGGRLVDTTNVLTSRRGSYQTVSHLAAFKDSVVLINPEYRVESDTLQYNTVTKVAYTKGPTVIIDKDSTVLNAEAGSEFNTTQKQSIFGLGTVETRKYTIQADQLFLDDAKKRYTAEQNVVMVSKDNDVIITGQYAYHLSKEGITKVYGNPVMKKIMTPDTLYLSADTLVSIEDSLANGDRILAFHKVKIYRQDLQGIADSLAYHVSDSVLYFFEDPVLWNKGSQITADSINLEIRNNTMHKMNTTINSFVISQDTIRNFNQVKGRNMEAFFEEGNLSKINVYGNGETIYYPLQADTITVGMNKIVCSDIFMEFLNNEISKIHFYVKPEASLIPPHEIKKADSRLQGFAWRPQERPTKAEVINRTESAAEKPVIPDYTIKPVSVPGKRK